ncbi:MAG: hypothetical protein HUJ56_08880 [Erysipelotrichaceae bacterium]|nr:hypothetical protein [Erysipelotrichaceae bacterium]
MKGIFEWQGMGGKDCTGITAVGAKIISAIHQYSNLLLNDPEYEDRQNHLLINNGNGIRIGTKIYKVMANLFDHSRFTSTDGYS